MPTTRTATTAISVIGTLAAMALAGCTATQPDAARSSITSTPSPGTPTLVATATVGSAATATSLAETGGTAATAAHARFTAEEQAVADAYVAAMDAINQAAAYPPNPNHPALFKTMAGELLVNSQKAVASLLTSGQSVVLPPNTAWEVEVLSVAITGDDATIEACSHDDAQVVDSASGAIVDSDTTTAKYRAGLTRIEGRWMARSRNELGKWDGVRSCEGS